MNPPTKGSNWPFVYRHRIE
uniref:Uncharacterized protein n=1 Tax=Anguilla anguilla TaxID=7936 RepID=A0A0E9PYZ0_ANGAN